MPESLCNLYSVDLSDNNLCEPYQNVLVGTGNQQPFDCDYTERIYLWNDWYLISNTLELDMTNKNLTTEIPQDLFLLTNLTKLKLGDNSLSCILIVDLLSLKILMLK